MSPDIYLRPEQQAIVDYAGGKMAIAAVPGSGKTFTLSHLAARLVEQLIEQGSTGSLERQEVLIVTFTNTAVSSFYTRIKEILQQERGLLPYVGFRVRTLHGLAHDIVRERPGLVGLAEDFQIIDERVATQIIREVARTVLPEYLPVFQGYIDSHTVVSDRQMRRIENVELPKLAGDLGLQFIKHAKNNLLEPAALYEKFSQQDAKFPLAEFGAAIYEDYQRSLNYRGAVDFDDLVRLAIVALHEDETYRQRLQTRWTYILEDEAQDSSRLQEEMLGLLSAGQNWVRVGDSNQAINTTFTTADPRFLREFLRRSDVQEMPLYTSGRSAQPIIDLANRLVYWTLTEHPVLPLRDAFLEQAIKPTGPDDVQVNPPAAQSTVYIHYEPGENVAPKDELDVVARNVTNFWAEHKDYTIAILAPENSRVEKMSELLLERGVALDDRLLRTKQSTREAASMIRHVLLFLSNPLNNKQLATLYREVWVHAGLSALVGDDGALDVAGRVLMGCRQVEQFLWPVLHQDWLDSVDVLADRQGVRDDLTDFRQQVQLWLDAIILPVDQLVLTVAQRLFVEPTDIALAHKIAVVLRGMSRSNPDWRLTEFVEELRMISDNQRKFAGFDDAEQGYEAQPGVVTVATMHSAKGLEWDRVYLLGVSNYGFPSAQVYDNYVAEKWYVRDSLNLEAEMLGQLNALITGHDYVEGVKTEEARLDYARERLRLLYVGITRARRDLMIAWNMGRFWERGDNFKNQAALPLVALSGFVQDRD